MSIPTNVNKIILVGKILKDGRNHRDQYGEHSCMHFTLITEESIKKNGAEIVHTEYHEMKLPAKFIDGSEQQLRAGTTMYIEGSIKTRSFIDRENVRRYKTEIWVQQYQILSHQYDRAAVGST